MSAPLKNFQIFHLKKKCNPFAVPLNYDADSLESVKEREVLHDIKTEFVPATVAYRSQHRKRRDTVRGMVWKIY